MNQADCIRVVLKGNVEKALKEKQDLNIFAKNLRRAEEYDAEECPERWKPAIEWAKKTGYCNWPVFETRFGERKLVAPQHELERIIDVINYAAKNNAAFPWRDSQDESSEPNVLVNVKSLGSLAWSDEIRDALVAHGTAEADERIILTRMEDKLRGFSLIYSQPDYFNGAFLKIWGFPEQDIRKKNNHLLAFELGHINHTDLMAVCQMRFMYVFGGIKPAEDQDIINALAKLNNLPPEGTHISSDEAVHYELVERQLAEVAHSKGVRVIFDEAQEAKARGLFADVKVYELVGQRLPKRDPVIVGIDQFRQKYAIIYWAGDKGLQPENK